MLLERDEALRKAREDTIVMPTVTAEWETEVASIRAQLEQDRATLEGAWSWRSQAEERAKEAEQLRVELADKAPPSPRRRSDFSRSGTHASKRRLSSSRSESPLLRLRPLSSASV
jgi:hypothetical protein